MNRRAAAMKIFRYLGDRLVATDRLERNRAFPGSGNALYGDFLENHFYRARGCLNDHSFILTKIFPASTDGCSPQVNHTRFSSDFAATPASLTTHFQD